MIRILVLGVVVAGLAGCETTTAPPQRTTQAQAAYDRMLAGKVAGPPERCLPAYRAQDMTVIDDNTILFRDGSTVYVTHPPGGCRGLGRAGNSLVTNIRGGANLCRGDISRVVDLQAGLTQGSCSMGDFIPFRPARR